MIKQMTPAKARLKTAKNAKLPHCWYAGLLASRELPDEGQTERD
jgi:hypothetical protein